MQSYSPNRGFYVVHNRIELQDYRYRIDSSGSKIHYGVDIGGIVNRLSIHVGPYRTLRIHVYGDSTKGNKVNAVIAYTRLLRASNRSEISYAYQSVEGDADLNIDVSNVNEHIFFTLWGEAPVQDSDDATLWIDKIEFLI